MSALLGVDGVVSTQKYVPFWIRSNQYGSVPVSGYSASVVGTIKKNFDTAQRHLVDWSACVDGRVNIGQISNGTLIEGYAKLRVSVFELMAGRAKQNMGLVDSSISSGAFAISGNALGIPQIQISIPEYFSIPILGKLLAFKGNFANGWVGDIPIQYSNVKQANTYFFQESFYGSLGKPSWRFKFTGGINHQGFWGNEKSIFGPDYKLSPWQTYLYALTAKTYDYSKIGKQMGSADLGAEYDFSGVHVSIYRQFFIYIGAFFHLANLRDGLNGLSFRNKKQDNHLFRWHKLLFEVFYSKDQAGYPWSKSTPSGAENYYNNYLYTQGWSYRGVGLGNPFITPYTTTRAGLPNAPNNYFNNNRLVALYLGFEGSLGAFVINTKCSYSLNYGTFATSPWGVTSAGVHTPPIWGQFGEVEQFSGYLEVSRKLNKNWTFGFVAGIDNGGLFYNSTALLLKFSKGF